MSTDTLSRNAREAQLRNHRAFIADSALEYFIHILTNGAFLATFTKYFGISDSLAGIIASISTFTASFQLFSSSIRIKSSRIISIVFGFVRSVLLVGMYLLLTFVGDEKIRAVLFVFAILSSSVMSDLSNPRKSKWMISLVDEKERGRFTANNSIVSVATGIIFTYVMSAVNDHFKAAGKMETVFVINGLVLLAIAVLRVVCLALAEDRKLDDNEAKSTFFKNIPRLLKNKKFMSIAVVFAIWTAGSSISVSFYGTYYIGELGLSLRFISIVSIFASIVNIVAIRIMGRFADRKSFERLLRMGTVFAVFTYVAAVFMVPSSGVWMYVIFQMLNTIASASVVCSKAILVYASVPDDLRVDALALASCTGGIISFFSTLAMSPFVEFVQRNGNSFLGISAYAQQFTSVFSAIVMMLTVILASYIVKKSDKKSEA